MRPLLAFLKKEMTEQLRSGRLTVLGILFLLFGIMNPAVAKLTPWLLEILGDSLAENGMTVTEVTVSAMDSWVQFYKNLPMALIAFVLLESSIFTGEYSSGTLVLSLTKGLERSKVVIAKTAVPALLWTVGYWLCFGITYGYNAYFWDNALAENLLFSVTCWWVFGGMTVSLMTLFAILSDSSAGVLLGTGGVILAFWLIGLLPKSAKYMPTFLTDGYSLIRGITEAEAYVPALFAAAAVSTVSFAASIPLFNKKPL